MESVENLNKLYDGLSEAIYNTVVQTQHEDSAKAIEAYMSMTGMLTKKSASKKATVTVIEAETIEGLSKYTRPNGDMYFARKWGEHNDVEVVRKAHGAGQFVLLYGAPGTGKTAVFEAAFGDDLYTVLGTGDTEVSDFVGGYVQNTDGGFNWVDGPLIKAAEEGKPLLIDEIGIIDPKVLTVVYGLMDGRKELAVTANPERGTVKAKDGFFVVAATNPNAPGVNLSEALLSRFKIHSEMTTDWNLARKLGVPTNMVGAAQNLAKKQQTGEVSWAPQMRELLAFKELATTFGTKWAVQNLLAQAPEMDRPVVADTFTRVYGEEIRPAKI